MGIGSPQKIGTRIGSGQGVKEIKIKGALLLEVEEEGFQKTCFFTITEFKFGKKLPKFQQKPVDLLILQGRILFHAIPSLPMGQTAFTLFGMKMRKNSDKPLNYILSFLSVKEGSSPD